MGTDGEQPVIARQILPVFEVLGIRPSEVWLIPTGLGGKFPQPAIKNRMTEFRSIPRWSSRGQAIHTGNLAGFLCVLRGLQGPAAVWPQG